eukprot:4615198-Alexandrium_andersonii.AAC.1
MSASLVGSEMCIRDRDEAAEKELKAAGFEVTPAGVVRGEAFGQARRVPVSYTHLTLPTICSV